MERGGVDFSMVGRRRKVLASGVFDLVHLGHVLFLRDAKKAGGRGAELLVVVARDSTVKRLKRSLPILPEDTRRGLVEALKPVDKAVLGIEKFDVPGIIKKYTPDVIALGYDQKSVADIVEKYVKKEKLPIKVVRIKKFGDKELNSSTMIKRRIVHSTG
jgi:FAD synthetase